MPAIACSSSCNLPPSRCGARRWSFGAAAVRHLRRCSAFPPLDRLLTGTLSPLSLSSSASAPAKLPTAMGTNADLSQRASEDTSRMDWTPSPMPSVWRKRVFQTGGKESGRVTSVVKYGAGSSFHDHPHPEGEVQPPVWQRIPLSSQPKVSSPSCSPGDIRTRGDFLGRPRGPQAGDAASQSRGV